MATSPARGLVLALALVCLAFPGVARSHYSYEDAMLLALSPDGELGLFVVSAGDTEGGADGETLLIARLGPGITPTGLVSILGTDADAVVAHQEVLPYVASVGSMMEHSEEERARAPGLRDAFMSGPVAEHRVTVEASARALAKNDGSFDAGGRPLTIDSRKDGSAKLRLGEATAVVADPYQRGLACVEAIYRTDDPTVFVVQIFAWEAGEDAACPADPHERFGPPPTRSFFRVVLSVAGKGGK